MARFQINPGADGAIEFEMIAGDGSNSVKTVLNPEESQGLVDLLAAARQLTPGTVAEAPAEGVVQAVVNPSYVVPAIRPPQGRVLILKHPGLGWIHFIFPDEHAAEVSKALAADLASAPPSSVN